MKKLKTTVKKSNKKRVSKNDIGYGVKKELVLKIWV